MNELLRQQISNHPKFTSVKREVVVNNVNIQGQFQQIVIDAEIKFTDEQGEEVTSLFKSKIENWIVNNSTLTTVRDTKGNPIANPSYKEAPAEGEDERTDEEKELYQRMPSFDYFFNIIKNPQSPSLINLLKSHIFHNDQINFFD